MTVTDTIHIDASPDVVRAVTEDVWGTTAESTPSFA